MVSSKKDANEQGPIRAWVERNQVGVFFFAIMLLGTLGLWYVDERADNNTQQVAEESRRQALNTCLQSNEARLGARRAIEALVSLALSGNAPETPEEQAQLDIFLNRFETEVLVLLAPIDCEQQLKEQFGEDIDIPDLSESNGVNEGTSLDSVPQVDPTSTTTEEPLAIPEGPSGSRDRGGGGEGQEGPRGPPGPPGPAGPPGTTEDPDEDEGESPEEEPGVLNPVCERLPVLC